MIHGIEIFKKYFEEHSDNYVLIGGSACDLIMDEIGLEFRPTKDLDVVLCVEVLDQEFVQHFYHFIHDGDYKFHMKSDGEKIYYRFSEPTQEDFPFMVEVFSRKTLALDPSIYKAPIAIADEIISLSAILLEEAYYTFIHEHKRVISGVSLVSGKCLIPLKIKAWVSNTERAANGAKVHVRDITKHREDVYRLLLTLTIADRVELPDQIHEDMINFISNSDALTNVEMQRWGWPTNTPEGSAKNMLETIYQL